MAKKKKHEDLPEGMSRRQAKLARRAAERAALEGEPRPYAGLAAEAQLIALQEFVPSATAEVALAQPAAGGRTLRVVTVLPGAAAAVVRDNEALVALQLPTRSSTPARDLAAAVAWALEAEDGQTLPAAPAGEAPALTELIDASATPTVHEHQDFTWWLPSGASAADPATARGLQAANDSVVPSYQVPAEVPGAVWWVYPGGDKAHIRWVLPTEEPEDTLLTALARVAARGDLHLGEETKFAGVFRTHGVVVPVFDLDPQRSHDSYGPALEAVAEAVAGELAAVAGGATLSAQERRQLQNIKSREVTIR
ncbi:DUF5926 family protein [Corynebacterium uberis]|uniref:DUF5926 family protein n=1 Tax=Corynebacterium TaxID=1716 RepID=UPI001D0A193A|nr:MULTISPECIES: DUF5926 family protein [Corynebacterium]MCZ9309574.1 DUF5926 family protein [Corynebacterium sp. c6VSa_13]UDL73386.1 DUF5926 family protein [Corynebacterium uberis]UDL75735.1 DUF5926 family protein [Corynebacterium uberis]UDL77947.1 DUF5926 family protein [Corynebacterium uberis]UDL80231.1 DUF5926 family protein [Corynebacterium uberis]